MFDEKMVEDAWRDANFRVDVINAAIKNGKLTAEHTEEEFDQYCKQLAKEDEWFTYPVPRHVGDDLSDERLHSIWNGFAGDGEEDGWLADKAHQIGYRLVLRLVRAEMKVSALEAELEELKSKHILTGI